MSTQHKDITGDDAIHPIMYVQSADPGAVGANKFWLDTTAGAALESGAILKQRDGTDTGWTTRADVSSIPAGSLSNNIRDVPMQFTVGDGTNAITTGFKGFLEVPAGTIVAVRLYGDVSGSIVLDLWKDTYANFPPTVADTITASAKPTLSTAQKSEDTTLTGWTTSTSSGDIIGVNVDSASTVTQVTVVLVIRRS